MRCTLTLIAFVAGTSPALAHKLIVEAIPQKDVVRIEVYYDDETPAQNAKVTVRSGERVVAEGRTDDTGAWSFARPAPGNYSVRAESLGHAAKDIFVIPDPNAQPSPPVTELFIPSHSGTADREEKTGTPWRRLGLGLGIIVGVAVTSYVLRKATPRKPAG